MMVKIKFLIIFIIFSFNVFANSPNELDRIFVKILDMRLEHPTIVISQVILETGHLESDLFKSNNNMFGMKRSGNRATTSTKMINGYKYYDHWECSLIDYGLLQMAYYKDLSREEYFQKLSKSYSSSDNYVATLKEIENNLHKYLTEHSLVL
jgi:uncharacterized FlgJ-related protein